MRRTLAAAWLVAVALTSSVAGAAGPERSGAADVDRARDLDAFGAKAFREGRYRDAILYFTEAYRLGAPSIELWNVARCHEKLDEVDSEAELLERFVDAPDAAPADRAEAARVLDEIRHRPSELVVDPGPTGGVVILDDRRVTRTSAPVLLHVTPGAHVVSVERAGGESLSTTVEARHGHALSVHPSASDDELVLAGSASSPRRASAALDFGAFFPRLGGYGAPLAPAVDLALRYAFVVGARFDATAGARFVWTQDRWASGALPPSSSPTGCVLPRDFLASDLSAFLTLGGGYRFTRRLRAGAELGFGIDTLVASVAGGEVFEPDCSPTFGVRPAAHVSLDASYLVAPAFRVVVTPAILEAHPAFSGARGDSTSMWLRAGGTLGVAVDL